MRRAVMAFWSDKSLPKAAETTIANSVSPQLHPQSTAAVPSHDNNFVRKRWRRLQLQDGRGRREKEVVYHMCGFTGSSFPLSA